MMFRLILSAVFCFMTTTLFASELYVGHTTCDITPDRPVALQGQVNTRIANSADTPITANILALESREGENSLDTAVIVSFDLCKIPPDFRVTMEEKLAELLPGFNTKEKLILAATHTHTAMVLTTGDYVVPDGVMAPEETRGWIADRVAPAIVEAWNNRVPASFSFGLGSAVVAANRRSVFEDGKAIMYGFTDHDDFRKMEGMEDHDLGTMFFWNQEGQLLAMIVNLSCPAQEVEGDGSLNADFWYPTRELLHKKYGNDVTILALCGAAGDLSPHVQYRRGAYFRMAKLRNNSTMEEIARRIVQGVDEVYPVVEPVRATDVPFVHKYVVLNLPQQVVSKEVYEEHKKVADEYKKEMEADSDKGAGHAYCFYRWNQSVIDRYESQQKTENPTYAVPVHVIRLGDTALVTNPFELYTDFGIQMKARSRAQQTFVVQFCGQLDVGGYVPSPYAASMGGYGAIPISNKVGAPGGQILTDKTIELMNSLF